MDTYTLLGYSPALTVTCSIPACLVACPSSYKDDFRLQVELESITTQLMT